MLEPILKDIQGTLLSWLARGVAGCVSDKSWGCLLGERNSGKSALVNLCLASLGTQLVGTLNADSFAASSADADSAKALGFLLTVEHARMVFTNEIKADRERGSRINGALIKKFASGGDTIVARPLYHDPCMFKLSGRLLMCANDMPDVKPQDTCETLDYFESPSKFVDKDDERLGTHDMYLEKDDSVKDFVKSPEAQRAMIWALLEAYQDAPVLTPLMQELREEFVVEDNEKEHFLARFEFTRDYENDFLEIANISVAASIVELSASSRLYNRWLKNHGARMDRKTIGKKQKRVWTGIKEVPEEMLRNPQPVTTNNPVTFGAPTPSVDLSTTRESNLGLRGTTTGREVSPFLDQRCSEGNTKPLSKKLKVTCEKADVSW